MTVATLILMLVSGHITVVMVEKEACEMTVQMLREGKAVTLEDNEGRKHEVEMARCVIDHTEQAGGPTS